MEHKKTHLDESDIAYSSEELAIDVGVNVLSARTQKGWTQEQLAKRMNTLQPSIARVERGNTLPSLEFLLRIALALGTGVVAPSFASVINAQSPAVDISLGEYQANMTTVIQSPAVGLGKFSNATGQEFSKNINQSMYAFIN